MKKNIASAVKDYQCSGCMGGPALSCYEENVANVGCRNHVAGTLMVGIGRILLGMPSGFNRYGESDKLDFRILEKFEKSFDKYNVPIWKYLNKSGHTFVRAMSPRVNKSILIVYLEDCLSKIDCLEITEADVEFMD